MNFEELAKYHSLSLMKWDEDFYASENTQLAKAFYEAGQQAKQEEINQLKAKINEVLSFIDSDQLGYDARLGDFYIDILEILK